MTVTYENCRICNYKLVVADPVSDKHCSYGICLSSVTTGLHSISVSVIANYLRQGLAIIINWSIKNN